MNRQPHVIRRDDAPEFGRVVLDEDIEQTMVRIRAVLERSEDCVSDAQEQLFRRVAQQLAEAERNRAAPAIGVMRHIGSYWRNWLLVMLRTGPYRPSTIRRLLSALDPSHPVSQRMLTQSLRMLERDGLIARAVIPDELKHVEYSLTPLGNELSDLLMSVIAWAYHHSSHVAQARASFDAETYAQKPPATDLYGRLA